MNLVTKDDFFFLFLQVLESDINLIKEKKWLIVNPIRNDTKIEVIHDTSLNYQRLNISVGSGLLPLTASVTIDENNIEKAIDSNRGIRDRDRNILPIDASLIYQPVRNYNLNFEPLGQFSGIFPMLQDPQIYSNGVPYQNYQSFTIPYLYTTPERLYNNINDTQSDLINNLDDDKVEDSLSRVWLLNDIPLGLLFLNCFGSNNDLLYSIYCPSPEGGLFPGEFLGDISTETSPFAVSLSISYCLLYDRYDLALLQIKELLMFFEFSKVPGLPFKFKRVWNEFDINNLERDLSINIVSFIFLITSLYFSPKDKFPQEILSKLNDYIESFIDMCIKLSPEDLTLEGFDEEGFSIYNTSLTNSFLLCVLVSLYLSSTYSFKFHEKVIKIKKRALSYFYNLVNFENLSSLDSPFFFFAAHLFEELIQDSHFSKIFSELKDNLSLSPPQQTSSIVDRILYHYLDTKYSNYFPLQFEQILENVYGEVGSNKGNIYITCIKGILEKDFEPKQSFFNLKSEELNFRESLRQNKTISLFPINKEWYSEEQVEGIIKDISFSLIDPLSTLDLFITDNRNLFNIESQGLSLSNFANSLSIKRNFFEDDNFLREKIRLKFLNSFTKEGFKNWFSQYTQLYGNIEDYTILYNNIPSSYYKREEFAEFSSLFGFPKREKFIKVTNFDIEDLYFESLNNIKINGPPGIYVLDKNNKVIFKNWTEIFGTIYILLEKGFSQDLFFDLKDNIPLGIDFKIVDNNIIYY